MTGVGLEEMTPPPTMHVPFAVDVPPGWRAVEPPAGQARAAFAAVRDTDPAPGFRPAITIDLERATSDVDYVAVADTAAGRLAAQVAGLVVLDRRTVGGDGPPGIVQLLRLRTEPDDVGEPSLELVQSQVYLGIGLDAARRDTLLVQLTCTSTPAQADVVAAEFEQFVASFRLRREVPETEEEQPDGG
ncbi:MAG TPA: hypothetical protein VE442_00615 [Jatrophihabitans sp.]|jgi:hypothetical protein|nr:hypothetical protein [Jatrophihabitans sp.]